MMSSTAVIVHLVGTNLRSLPTPSAPTENAFCISEISVPPR